MDLVFSVCLLEANFNIQDSRVSCQESITFTSCAAKKKKKKKIDSWEKNIPDVKKDNELVGFLHGLKILVQE